MLDLRLHRNVIALHYQLYFQAQICTITEKYVWKTYMYQYSSIISGIVLPWLRSLFLKNAITLCCLLSCTCVNVAPTAHGEAFSYFLNRLLWLNAMGIEVLVVAGLSLLNAVTLFITIMSSRKFFVAFDKGNATFVISAVHHRKNCNYPRKLRTLATNFEFTNSCNTSDVSESTVTPMLPLRVPKTLVSWSQNYEISRYTNIRLSRSCLRRIFKRL